MIACFFLNFQIRVEVFKICKLLTHTVFIWMSCGTQFSLVTYMDNTKPKEGSYPTYTCTMNHWNQIKEQLPQHTGKNSRESRFTWYFSYEFYVKSSLRDQYVRYVWQQYFMWISCEIYMNFPFTVRFMGKFSLEFHMRRFCLWYERFKIQGRNWHNADLLTTYKIKS